MSVIRIRCHERIDYKRCQKKWFWKWRKGLVPKALSFGPLELGTWVHNALAPWYGRGTRRNGSLLCNFITEAASAIAQAQKAGAPDYLLEKAEQLAGLGAAMMSAYAAEYGNDPDVRVLGTEVPLDFSIPIGDATTAHHILKPDLVYQDVRGDAWLMEHKTAATIRTGHLVIDDQARTYGVMAEQALRKAGILRIGQRFRGIMYNFIRKALPDMRERDATGKALNKNGTVSARQTAPMFLRHPVRLTRTAKAVTLNRLRDEVITIATTTTIIRAMPSAHTQLSKTPHSSCERFCQFFALCVAEENGTDTRDMERLMYVRQNPYDYGETTDDPSSFEMG